MDKVARISGGLFFGFLVGALTVALLAPRSGAETRMAIQERIEAILEEGRQAADARRLELTAQLDELKKPPVRTIESSSEEVQDS